LRLVPPNEPGVSDAELALVLNFMTMTKTLGKVRLEVYRLRSKWRRKTVTQSEDQDEAYSIDPQRIKLSFDHPGAEGLPDEEGWSKSPLYEAGCVVAGEWDLNTIPFEEMDVWQAFQHRFLEDGKWEKTAFFERNMRLIDSGRKVWGCASREDLVSRLRRIEAFFEKIKTYGYRHRTELTPEYDTWFSEVDDVRVHIGRSGDYIFADGRHRLCIAKLLGLEKIPVRVSRRHKDWVDFRREILDYAAHNGGKVYAPLMHPDLRDIPSHHGKRRLHLLERYVPNGPGRLLDIGSHWGYFCHRFEELAYNCTAVEFSPVNAYFMRKLKRAENRSFEVYEGSALDYPAHDSFGIVLALNVFHHFIKTRESHAKLEKFLSTLTTQLMLFEPHLTDDPQMTNAHRNYPHNEFVAWISKLARLNSVQQVGTAEDGRPLFLLAR
jgi:hypothetical protein